VGWEGEGELNGREVELRGRRGCGREAAGLDIELQGLVRIGKYNFGWGVGDWLLR